jgi:hypothetical protein
MPLILSHYDYAEAKKTYLLLDAKVADGTATKEEREVYEDAGDHMLIYDWAKQGRWEKEQLAMGRCYDDLYRRKEGVSGYGSGSTVRSGRDHAGTGQPKASGVVAHLARPEEKAKEKVRGGNGVVAYL